MVTVKIGFLNCLHTLIQKNLFGIPRYAWKPVYTKLFSTICLNFYFFKFNYSSLSNTFDVGTTLKKIVLINATNWHLYQNYIFCARMRSLRISCACTQIFSHWFRASIFHTLNRVVKSGVTAAKTLVFFTPAAQWIRVYKYVSGAYIHCNIYIYKWNSSRHVSLAV